MHRPDDAPGLMGVPDGGGEPGSHSDGEGLQSHLKESEGLEYSCGAGGLPDGVHGQLGAAQIQHPQT